MGHIKEPPGVDFIIQSKPLTDDDRTKISEFIRNYKAKQSSRRISRKTTTGMKTKKPSSKQTE